MEDKEGDKVGKPQPSGRITRCNVPLCKNTNRTREGILFFSLPLANPTRCYEWCKAARLPDVSSRHYRICMDHFREEDYVPNYSDLLPEFNYRKKPRLRRDVVPSLLLPDQLEAISAAAAKDAEEKVGNDGQKLEGPEVGALSIGNGKDPSDLHPSSPSPPKKRRVYPQTSMAELFLKPEMQKSCLICLKNNAYIDPNLYKFAGSNGFPLLNRQLWQTFVFRKLLKLPSWKYEEILMKTGSNIDPGEWLNICGVCIGTINKILRMQQEIRVIKVKVDRLKQSVEKKFVGSVDKCKDIASGSGPFFNIHSEIRSFMKDSKEGPWNLGGNKPFEASSDLGEAKNLDMWDDDLQCEEKCDTGVGVDMSYEEWLHNPSSNSNKNHTLVRPSDSHIVEEKAAPGQDPRMAPKRKRFRNSNLLRGRDFNMVHGKFQCKICLRKYNTLGKCSTHLKFHAKSKKVYDGAFDCFKCRAPYVTRKSLEYHFRSEHCMRLHESWEISLPQEKYAFTQKTKKEVLAKLINEGKMALKNSAANKESTSSLTPPEALGKHTGEEHLSGNIHKESSEVAGKFDSNESMHSAKKSCKSDENNPDESEIVSDEDWLPGADEKAMVIAQNDSPTLEKSAATAAVSESEDDDEDVNGGFNSLQQTNISRRLRRRGLNKSGRFQCKICLRFYKTRSTHKAHLKFHVQTKKIHNGAYDCSICKAPFGTKKSLQSHFRSEHSMKLHESWDPSLPQGEYTFNGATKREVFARLARESKLKDKDLYECSLCPMKFFSEKTLENHIEYHKQSKELHNGRLDCSKCKVPFKTIRPLREHLRRYHQLTLHSKWDGSTSQENTIKPAESGDTDSNVKADRCGMYKCTGCDAEFKLKAGYDDHMRLHESAPSDLHCRECHRPFSTKNALAQHLWRAHKISDSTKICELCGFDSKTKSALRTHMTKHKLFDGSVDPSISTTHFVCTICKELFKTRRSLSAHRLHVHFEELGIEAFKCTEGDCKKVFLRQDALVDHIAEKHKNVIKFQCEKCGYKAFTQHRLVLHSAMHEKTTRVCEYCSAVYYHINGFKAHMKRYHPEKFQPAKQNYFQGVQVDKLDHEYGHDGLPMGTTGFQKPCLTKEFPCKYCSSVFPHKLALKYHFNSSHKDLFVFKCNENDCQRVYMSEQSLKLHKKINHSGNTSVSCGWCLKVVSHKIKLYDHQKTCPKKPEGPNVPKILVAEDNTTENSIDP